MKNETRHETLSEIKEPILIRKFVDHNSGARVHFHEEIEILYFTRGGGRIICDMKEYEAAEGDIVFINGNELHAGCFDGRGSIYYCIQVKTALFHNLIGKEYVRFENIIRSDLARRLLDKVIFEAKQSDFKSIIAVKKALFEFFSCISENHVRSVFTEADYKKQFERLDTFNSVIEYIDAHYSECLSVSGVAAHFFMSTSYFSHLFKRRVGKSLVEYLSDVRMRHAKRLLETESLSIGEIAARVGFADINYFSRRFKKECGATPTEYRRSSSKLL